MTDHPRTQSTLPPDPIDAFFDGDLDESGARRLVSALRADPGTADRFVGTHRAVNALRAPVESPDLTARILSRLDQRRSLSRRLRFDWTGGWSGRFAAGLGLVAGLVALYALNKLTPPFSSPTRVATAPETSPAPTPRAAPAIVPRTTPANAVARHPSGLLGPLNIDHVDVHAPTVGPGLELAGGGGNFRIRGPLGEPIAPFRESGRVEWGGMAPSFLGLPIPPTADRIDLFGLPAKP